MWSQIRDKLRINRQFIHKNEKLKRSTIVISSHKYVVPVIRKSEDCITIITVITIPLATHQDIILCYKDNVLPDRNCGLATFHGYKLNDFIIFFNLTRHLNLLFLVALRENGQAKVFLILHSIS